MSDRVLIIGASELQLPLIDLARQKGLYIGIVDRDPHAVGVKSADVFFPVSTTNIAGVVDVARNFMPQGIVTMATDMPMRALAAACEALHLPGISQKCALACTDKGLMMSRFHEAEVPSPWFRVYSEISEYIEDIADLPLPCILKPVDSSGSRGVVELTTPDEAIEMYEYAVAASREGRIIVEELLVGQEISVEILCESGKPRAIATTSKTTTGAPHFVEIGHSQPADLTKQEITSVTEVACAAVRALGITTGAAHVELMVTYNGPKLIEVGARLGGDYITSHLTPMSTGVNMVEAVLDMSLGRSCHIPDPRKGGSAIRYITAGSGIVTSVSGMEQAKAVSGVAEAQLTKPIGYHYGELHGSDERLGYVIAKGSCANEAISRCNEAISLIHVEVQSDTVNTCCNTTSDSMEYS